MFDWQDVRFFLAVAETGSTLAAGRTLRVSQTTAARRVAALETALGVTLFDRRQQGYRLTAAGQALLPPARRLAVAAAQVADEAASQHRSVGGLVRVTAIEIQAVTVLVPILRDLHEAHPAIHIELDSSEAHRDLANGAADIAIRLCDRPSGAGLIGRRIADDPWTLYCSRAYAAAHGRPRSRRELAGHALIAGGEAGLASYYRRWLEENGLRDAVAMNHGSSSGLLAAVRAGIGLAALPCLVADQEPDLLRCLPPSPTSRGLWLLIHERSRHAPPTRIVLEFLAERLGRLRNTAPLD